MICLVISGAALLRVCRRGGLYSLTFYAKTEMVGIFPNGCFRRCYPFIYFICNLHAFKHVVCCLVGTPLKLPALYIGLILPAVGESMEENFVELFGAHRFGDA